MKWNAVNSEEFKLYDSLLPTLADGKYKAVLSQTISIGEGGKSTKETYTASEDFYVVGRAFTLQADSVFSIYPTENAEGNFLNELPFIVLNLKTFPWQYECGNGQPWVALIVISEEDVCKERDMSIRELLSNTKDDGIFFPVEQQPEFYQEHLDDVCHVIELSKETYEEVMPKTEERKYLCHGKYVNLAKTEEDISGRDGFFSVVIGNRFFPSKEERTVKSTVHLVSVLGYDNADFSSCHTIRLCSLYRWSVFSQCTQAAGFGKLIKKIDSKQFGRNESDHELKKRGVVALEHRFRSGETTASLYCSPLLPAPAPECKIKESTFEKVMESRHTADGHLIYDKEKGIFDTKYACAWQLGRMLSLSDDAMASKIYKWRSEQLRNAHKYLLRENMGQPDFGELCKKMRQIWTKSEETETLDRRETE